MPHMTVEMPRWQFVATMVVCLAFGFVGGWIVMDDPAGHAAFMTGFRAAFGVYPR